MLDTGPVRGPTAPARRRPYAVTPYQRYDLAAVGLTAAQAAGALQWVDAGGRTHEAEDAVARALLASRWWVRPVGALLLAPGVHGVAGAAYHWVSRHRHRFPGGTPTCAP